MDSFVSQSSRLKNVQSQAVVEVLSQISYWKKVKKDYEDLANLLTTLPDKPFHNVMVPFGSLAIMPGKLIHTNELLVHLGDSWFADISCKQGLDIINLRLKKVDKNLDDLEKVLQNLENKKDFVEELDNSGEDPRMEIKEDVPSSYLHPSRRKRISRVKIKPEASNSVSSDIEMAEAKQSCFDDEALLKRLDELERQEKEEDQLLLSESVSGVDNLRLTSEKANDPNSASQVPSKSSSTKTKSVSWDDKVIEGKFADSDDSDDASPTPAVIKFHHTSSTSSEIFNKNKQDNVILHPGDIGRIQSNTSNLSRDISVLNCTGDSIEKQIKSSTKNSNPSKSILKPSTQASDETSFSHSQFQSLPSTSLKTVVHDVVVERASEKNKAEEKIIPKKRVSKFKASRQK